MFKASLALHLKMLQLTLLNGQSRVSSALCVDNMLCRLETRQTLRNDQILTLEGPTDDVLVLIEQGTDEDR